MTSLLRCCVTSSLRALLLVVTSLQCVVVTSPPRAPAVGDDVTDRHDVTQFNYLHTVEDVCADGRQVLIKHGSQRVN